MMLPCVSRRVVPTLNATGPKKDDFFARNHALHPWTLSVRVCVWMPALVVSVLIAYDYEPVFGVSKTSISGFVAVGPHCVCVYACSRSSCVDRI